MEERQGIEASQQVYKCKFKTKSDAAVSNIDGAHTVEVNLDSVSSTYLEANP